MGKNKVREQEAIRLTRKFIYGFYEKTIYPENMRPYLSENCFVWIGAAEGEIYDNAGEALAAFSHQRDLNQIPLIHIRRETYQAFTITPTVILVISQVDLHVAQEHKIILSERQRGTHLFRVEKGELKLVHIHASNPWVPMGLEKRFPLSAGRASYEYMQQLIADKEAEHLPALTPRQKLVLELLSQGKTYQNISDALGITTNTVRYHVGELRKRFKVKNRSELLATANRMK